MPLTDWIPTGYATLMQRLLYKIILIRIFNSLLQFIIVFIKLTFFYSGFKSLFPTFSNGKIPTILFSYLPDMNVCMYVNLYCTVKLHSNQYLIQLCEIKKIGLNKQFLRFLRFGSEKKKEEQIDFSECSEDIEVNLFKKLRKN